MSDSKLRAALWQALEQIRVLSADLEVAARKPESQYTRKSFVGAMNRIAYRAHLEHARKVANRLRPLVGLGDEGRSDGKETGAAGGLTRR